MITTGKLVDGYRRNLEIIEMQTAGLTQQDSLIQLPFRANCLNWVVGHVLANRCNILMLLGGEDLRSEINLDRYERESDGIQGPGEGVLELSELLTHLKTSQYRLEEVLEGETEETLQREVSYRDRPEQSVAYWLFFLYFHDTYHVGQTEILRQAAGVDDKII
jgi:hypothetical protein